jgi:probable rRNA maturation factor
MKPEARHIPAISVRNMQRRIALDRVALEQFARRALNACLQERGRGLTSLEEIDVLLVSDRKMSELHCRFMGIVGPTDVITFQHGEICISVETAQRQAEVFETSLEHELRLYLVHGLLHLHGLDDSNMADRRRMRSAQERVVALALHGSKAADTGIAD